MRQRQSGFTLIEVLLATALLAAGLALAFTTLRAAGASVQRGESRAMASDEMRSVSSFLRRAVGGARPLPIAVDESSGRGIVFSGEPRRMRFIADLPDYLGHGGAYLHDIVAEPGQGGIALHAWLAIVLGGEAAFDETVRPPELLTHGLREARFRYRGLEDDGSLGQWSEHWQNGQLLPVQVEISLAGADGRPWPPLVIAVAQSNSYTVSAGGRR